MKRNRFLEKISLCSTQWAVFGLGVCKSVNTNLHCMPPKQGWLAAVDNAHRCGISLNSILLDKRGVRLTVCHLHCMADQPMALRRPLHAPLNLHP
jgi:hypothetical protein